MKQTKNNLDTLTSGRRLTKNTLWNLLGGGVPLAAAVFAIPVLIKGLGTDRFGVLTLAWMVVGYFSLFDLGLGRALTKLVAEKLGADQKEEVAGLVWTALALMAALGVAAVAVVAAFSPWLAHSVLKIPVVLQRETLKALYLLALSIPAIISTAGLRGILEAYQRFDLTNMLRIPQGIFTFLGPLAVLPFSNSLFPVVAVVVAGRFLAWGAHFCLCLWMIPALRTGIELKRRMVRPLVNFGSWMTVSNIIGPLMVYFDRFLIGAVISMAAVAYYATPYEVVTKLWLIPGALIGVLFPAFSTTLVEDRARSANLFGRGMNYIFLALFPLTLIIVTLAHEGLELWLGPAFAQHGASVLQWLAIGILANSLAMVPYALIQAAGRPDITAKLHLIELPFYLVVVWWLTTIYGIQGTAIAWVGRIAVDTVALFTVVGRLLPGTVPSIRRMALVWGVALLFLVLGVLMIDFVMKVIFLAGVMVSYVPVAWLLILTAEERSFVRNRLKLIPLFN